MSLFPAYSGGGGGAGAGGGGEVALDVVGAGLRKTDDPEYLDSDIEREDAVSPASERALLADPPPPAPASQVPKAQARTTLKDVHERFYVDRKMEYSNVAVSTLYFPARPEYSARDCRSAVGAGSGVASASRRKRVKRYWSKSSDAQSRTDDARDAAAHAHKYRTAIADDPRDEDLWLRYIDFQESCAESGGSADCAEAVVAAERAAAECGGSWRIRMALHHALRTNCTSDAYLTRLRDMLAATNGPPERRLELWSRLVSGVACAGGADCAGAVRAATAAAAHDMRHYPSAYPDLIYVYGSFLRSGGLSEQLVQLIELLAAMNFPPANFPPPRDPAVDDVADRQLCEYEDKVIRSGLPLIEVWSRVERARSAVQWRAPAHALPSHELRADPQRAPLHHDIADVLLPVAEPDAALRLAVALLRLSEAPLLPAGQYVQRALCPAQGELAASWACSGGEALMALVRAARRAPTSHALRRALAVPGAVARLAHFAPLRCIARDDSTGFEDWSNALWEAALQWTSDRRRLAVLCWRLRVLHARMMYIDHKNPDAASRLRCLRKLAREALRVWAGEAAAPFAVFARLEAAAAAATAVDATAGAAATARAVTAALHAVRAACADAATPQHDALYAARVAWELSAGAPEGVWALCCAATRAPLPNNSLLTKPPPEHLIAAAMQQCEAHCGVEQRGAAGPADVTTWALLPGEAEWAAARALLATPQRRRELLAELLDARRPDKECVSEARWERFCEQGACALVAASAQDARGSHVAAMVAHRFPLNAYLAIMSSDAPVWAPVPLCARAQPAPAPRGEIRALAAMLPALVRALAQDWPEQETVRVWRLCRRLCAQTGPAGGALLRLGALEAASRLHRQHQQHAQRALLDALHAAPHNKWLHVVGASLLCGCGAAGELPDLLLDKQLRLRALPDELAAPPPPPPPPTTHAQQDNT